MRTKGISFHATWRLLRLRLKHSAMKCVEI